MKKVGFIKCAIVKWRNDKEAEKKNKKEEEEEQEEEEEE